MTERDPLRGNFDQPTRYGLDEAIFAVHGHRAAFTVFDDHYDGLAPSMHVTLWNEMRAAAPSATTITEVVQAWAYEDLEARYRQIVTARYAEADAHRRSRA